MFGLKDLNELLDKMPLWKRIKESPERLDAIQKRLTQLENKLSGTGDICPKCKEPKLELESSQVIDNIMGIMQYSYKCSHCGFTKIKTEAE